MAKLPLPTSWRQQPFQMFFSGVEGDTHFYNAKSAGVRFMLMSYWHLRKKGGKDMMAKRFGDGEVKLMIDSGGHTFMQDKFIDQYKDKPISWWEDYIREYLAWAERNKQYIFAIVELDLDQQLGVEQIWKWRKKFFLPFEERTGIPVVYVYRTKDHINHWHKMCKLARYVGFSDMNDNATPQLMGKLIKIASQYGSVVHGFAMTKPTLLPKLPFFTVDSISWKMGEMYGVTYIWDGRKFHTIVKDKKEQARRRFKQKLIAMGCDWKKYSADDNNEVTRMNALAWVEVMKWVAQRLKLKMYWLDRTKKIEFDGPRRGVELREGSKKGRNADANADERNDARSKRDDDERRNARVRDKGHDEESQSRDAEDDAEGQLIEQDLDDIDFPQPGWFAGAQRDLNERCAAVNINPELPDEIKSMAFEDMTVLCTIVQGHSDYIERAKERYTPENLYDMTGLYFGKPIEDAAIAVEELTQFFTDVASGKNAWFYEFDPDAVDEGDGGAPPEPEERDEYVTEDEPLVVNDPKVEKARALLDEAGLPQVRDAAGKFLPGHSVRKPKNIYSAKYPKLACDTCYVGQSCPKFQSGKICAFNKMFERFDTRDPQDIAEMLFSMVNLNGQRLQRVAVFEMLEGGAVDPNLTGLLQMQMGMLREAAQMHQVIGQMKIGVVNPTTKVTVETNNPGMGSSLLQRLFSPPAASSDDDEDEFDDLDKTSVNNAPDNGKAPVRKRGRIIDVTPR